MNEYVVISLHVKH